MTEGRRLSSIIAPYHGWLFMVPYITVVIAVEVGHLSFGHLRMEQVLFPVFMLLFALVVIYWTTFRMYEVFADDAGLIIKGRKGEARVPYSAIYEVKDHWWFRPRYITIRLKKPCEFGDRILFLPWFLLFLGFWSAHPVADLIRRKTREARGRGIALSKEREQPEPTE